MLSKILPWKLVLQRAARYHGFIDPIGFLARMRQFSQPSEVAEPIELLRAGVQFHARGLLNTRAIQTNLDWLWPYWVERQFNAEDPSFIPRAFSFSHVNLTHRNWTAVGLPDVPLYPLVDPRGLITPLYDGWSIDAWVQSDSAILLPSKLDSVVQTLDLSNGLSVVTQARKQDLTLTSQARMTLDEKNSPQLEVTYSASGPESTRLIIAPRPYNPEGIQFIERVDFNDVDNALLINNDTPLYFDKIPAKTHFSRYELGDVIHRLHLPSEGAYTTECHVGMCTAAAEFNHHDNTAGNIALTVRIPLDADMVNHSRSIPVIPTTWEEHIPATAQLTVPDQRYQFLYDAAVRTLSQLSADDIVPGPYTYFRFWFRDACLMMNALLSLNMTGRVKRAFADFVHRQKLSGYFQSQEGEWDSNGQVLWILDRYEQVTGDRLDASIITAVTKAVKWIDHKRVRAGNTAHDGLLPPGFSAEHFGPNDYYYWDNYWSIAGLRAAQRLLARHGEHDKARHCEALAERMNHAVASSIEMIPEERSRGGIPASPYRRMDSGAIGSMVADYPLQLAGPDDQRIRRTAELLLQHCMVNGCFFQDMIHSGQNVYLSLALAQTLLRRGDCRYRQLVDTVAQLASDTGQWPEAIHPHTGGGCMGDGQHGWAAAEWVMLIKHLFVREENDHLVIGSGILPRWLESPQPIAFGPTTTRWGKVTVHIAGEMATKTLSLDIAWHDEPVPLEVRVPGYQPLTCESADAGIRLTPEDEKTP